MSEKIEFLSKAELESLFEAPGELVTRAQTNHLTDFHLDYLKYATFFVIASGGAEGLDASPRGGSAGLVQVLDRKRLCFGDWPGNNKIETLHNIMDNPNVGLLFLFPGLDIFMRINGRAGITVNGAVRARLAEGDKQPKVAVVVDIEAVYFHCGKAVNRAALWKPESRIERKAVPSPGVMMKVLADVEDMNAEELNAHYDDAMHNGLFG